MPLSTTDATLAELKARGCSDTEIEAVAAKSSEAAAARLSLEEPLAPPAADAAADVLAARGSDAALLSAYMALIEHELRDGNPGRVTVAYERAIAEFPYTVGLWQRYASYLSNSLGSSAAAPVHQRATRTCPWTGDIWAAALRNAERNGDAARLEALYATAVASQLQNAEDHIVVGLARMDAARRAGEMDILRSAARSALDAADAASGAAGHVDATLRVAAYWAQCEAAMAKSSAAARDVWEQLLKRGAYSSAAETWLAYAAHERLHGGVADARKVFKRCYTRRLECAAGYPPAGAASGQEAVCLAWLRLERELGSSDDYIAADAKVTPLLDAIASARAAAAAQAAAEKGPKESARKLTPDEVRRMRREKDPNYKAPAAEAANGASKRARTPTAQPRGSPKRARSGDELPGSEEQPHAGTHVNSATGADGVSNALLASVPAAGVQRSSELTVFVRNLPADATPEQLQALFVGAGVTPTAVRVPRDHATGAGRGFAYVEFGNEENVATALALEHPSLGNNKLSLARSKPPASGLRGAQRGGRGGGGGAHGRGRSTMERQPRLAVRGDHDESGGADRSQQPRSNADFRSLLLRRGGGAAAE